MRWGRVQPTAPASAFPLEPGDAPDPQGPAALSGAQVAAGLRQGIPAGLQALQGGGTGGEGRAEPAMRADGGEAFGFEMAPVPRGLARLEAFGQGLRAVGVRMAGTAARRSRSRK